MPHFHDEEEQKNQNPDIEHYPVRFGVSTSEGKVLRTYQTSLGINPTEIEVILKLKNASLLPISEPYGVLQPTMRSTRSDLKQRPLLIATCNQMKLREIRSLLSVGGVIPDINTMQELGFSDPPETEDTLVGNAVLKAVNGSKLSGLVSVSDDSGLFVDVLGGRPGVLTARYAPTVAEARTKLLSELEGLPAQQRSAKFVSVAAMADERGPLAGLTLWVEAECPGSIVTEIPSDLQRYAWGYDPLFTPFEVFPRRHMGKVFGRLDEQTKLLNSHRGRSFRALRHLLFAYIRTASP